mgnify:CR=1 FL=1
MQHLIQEPTDLQINDFITRAFREDVGKGDHTSLACIPANDRTKAHLLVKSDCVLAGVALAERIFKSIDKTVEFNLMMPDGTAAKYGDVAFTVECNSRALLQAERLSLNVMQRMSGIASLSREFVDKIEGTSAKLLDTRKTTPLLRFLEKWAVRIGGATNYRFGLYDWIMVKDNHVDACGGITQAIQSVADYQAKNDLKLGFTIETRNLDEVSEVMKVGKGIVTQIMLDNFELATTREAVELIGETFNIEASGGVNLDTVRPIAETGVDYISVGALTHSYHSKDLSLKVT